VSSYIWMRLLESAPQRYDAGVRLLSMGHIERVYRRVAELVHGTEVLDLGCGTGNMLLHLAGRGLHLVGVDISPGMLAVARKKIPPGAARLVQTGVAELTDQFPGQSFDTIVGILLFSELSEAEQHLALHQCNSLLRSGGSLILADEVPAATWGGRTMHNLLRVPLLLIAYLLTQTSTRPVRDLEAKLNEAGFRIVLRESNRLGDFSLVQAAKREE
jgi:ubiquinone/menaquinone biosynthesis C-methylase UbiE